MVSKAICLPSGDHEGFLQVHCCQSRGAARRLDRLLAARCDQDRPQPVRGKLFHRVIPVLVDRRVFVPALDSAFMVRPSVEYRSNRDVSIFQRMSYKVHVPLEAATTAARAIREVL